MKGSVVSGGFALSLLGGVRAQFPPPREGITVVQSKFHENVSISYKEPGICETTPGVKSYSGYVHLPPRFIDHDQDYPINTFFWFFEARKDAANAPLAIWLNGGPGGSSMMGLLEENGPCFVSADSKTTYLNPWSWNNEVNMLYIDQPVQTGFSYDVLTNVTIRLDVLDDEDNPVVMPTNFTDGQVPATNYTYRIGTLGSQKMSQTANTTQQAAHALWNFLQTWLVEFPHYSPRDDRLSLWAESYGGHYGPVFFRFFQEQSERIRNGSLAYPGARALHLDTLGIVDGVVDRSLDIETCLAFPYNNTYHNAQFYNSTLTAHLLHNWTRPHGWRDQMASCAALLDAVANGTNTTDPSPICNPVANEAFGGACLGLFISRTNRSVYDIAAPRHSPFPPPYLHGYLAREEVLRALGVPVNYTGVSAAVNRVFDLTFDPFRRDGGVEALAGLLGAGVKVHLVFGDRDLIANWLGGERVSLAVPYARQAEFAAAGYAPLVVPVEGGGGGVSGGGEEEGRETQTAGFTRQLGPFSFTRVFQAGHEVPAYQPAAAYEIFRRASFGLDIPTGRVRVTEDFRTEGLRDVWHVKNDLPEMPQARCYVLKPESCEPEVWNTVVDGTAVVEDWFVVGRRDEGEKEFDDEDL